MPVSCISISTGQLDVAGHARMRPAGRVGPAIPAPRVRCSAGADAGTRSSKGGTPALQRDVSNARAPRAGWQHHPVSTRRMHFVVPATQGPRSLADPGALPALVEARLAGRPAAAAPAPALPAACGDGEEEEEDEDGGGASPYIAPASVFDSPRHLLHGVLHQNGFGHLLRVNGREGGSAALSGARALPAGDPKRGAHGRLNLRPSMRARPWQGAGPPAGPPAVAATRMRARRAAVDGHLGPAVPAAARARGQRRGRVQQGAPGALGAEPAGSALRDPADVRRGGTPLRPSNMVALRRAVRARSRAARSRAGCAWLRPRRRRRVLAESDGRQPCDKRHSGYGRQACRGDRVGLGYSRTPGRPRAGRHGAARAAHGRARHDLVPRALG